MSQPGPESHDLLTVGRIGAARGTRGDVFVQPFTDAPEQRFAVGTVLATDPPEAGPLSVERLDLGGAKMVLRFEQASTREAAEALRGVRLVVPATDRPPIDDPDEFYASDLIGLSALTTNGQSLGPVRDVIDIAGADYLVVDIEGIERLIPFVSEIVPTVDVAGGVVRIDPPAGLFDL